MIMFSKKNKWKGLISIFVILNLLLGSTGFMTLGTAYAFGDIVFTVEINGVEEATFTLEEIKAMPVTTRSYSGGFYEFTGVDFVYLLESLDIDYDNWTVKLISGGLDYTLDFETHTESLLAYEQDGYPIMPPELQFYYGDNHKNVFRYITGIVVIKPEIQAPPILESDSTDNTVGESIDLAFEDDEAWRDAITEITVNGNALGSSDYTVESGKLTIDGSVFTEAGDYEIAVKAAGYEDVTIIQTIVAVSEPAVFTVEINGVEEATFTLEEIKAMPAITKAYGATGYYVRRGVDFLELLGSLNIDYDNWEIKLIMKDGSNILNFSTLIEPLLAYEENQDDSEFCPFPANNPLKLYYGDGTNHKLVYGMVTGIEVTRPGILTPPTLRADDTDNTVGKSIDLAFEDDGTWRDAITEITVNGNALGSSDYTVESGKLTIDGSVFTEAGDYEIAIKAVGYDNATVTQIIVKEEATGEVPPVLTASTTGNTVGNPIEIEHSEEAWPTPRKWEPAVTAVFVDNVKLESWQYSVEHGKLTIVPGIFNEVGDYTITVEAPGYQDATVTQTIKSRPEHFVSEGKGNIVFISGRHNTTTAIKNDGTVWAWGDGQSGKLGDGTTGPDNWRSVPGKVSDLTGVTAVASGESYTLALKDDGTVWAWGSNSSGTLGNENISGSSSVPVQVIMDGETETALTDVKAIATGDKHSLALKKDGTVWAWGSKSHGQLGDGTSGGLFANSKIPVQVITDLETGAALADIKAIAAGSEHSLALKEDGTVWAWGRNYYGQLGNESIEGSSSIPVQVMVDLEADKALTDIKAIACGQGHSFAIKEDGTVWGWGRNGDSSQLGDGSRKDTGVPVQVAHLTDIQSVSAGGNHTIALRDDGTIWGWGSNLYGQVGIGTDAPSYIPAQLCEASDIAMISTGDYYSMAVKNDGTVWTWGQNTKGKLGNGTTDNYPDDVPVPTQVRLAPQAVVPAAETTVLGDTVELNFTDDTAWRECITAVSVDEIDLIEEQYTVENGRITIEADVFTEAGEYTITIKASGFLDATVVQQIVEEGTPITYSVSFAVRDGEAVVEDTTIEVKNSEDEIMTAEIEGTYKLKAGDYTYTVIKEGFKEVIGNFTVEGKSMVIDIALEKEADEIPKYNIIPEEDPAYTVGETQDGFKTMTVNDNKTGLSYFMVAIEPIRPHEGTETVIFAHSRDGVQLQLNALVADFDKVGAAKAGFNVKPDDIIKVYIVDKLTNDTKSNSIVLQ